MLRNRSNHKVVIESKTVEAVQATLTGPTAHEHAQALDIMTRTMEAVLASLTDPIANEHRRMQQRITYCTHAHMSTCTFGRKPRRLTTRDALSDGPSL